MPESADGGTYMQDEDMTHQATVFQYPDMPVVPASVVVFVGSMIRFALSQTGLQAPILPWEAPTVPVLSHYEYFRVVFTRFVGLDKDRWASARGTDLAWE